ncbi:MAG: mannose-1-phosphate guanylyltransferase/mannose-6-phosphate isomerase [Pelagibaca sp.]|nr:mannose-1-phosphate guanylyltransferase/mannose-6-phosphate isomerase [Pelagibaca sp.]
MIPVILAGGSGERLWPLSRQSFPKQFLDLAGDQSLFQQTVMRAASVSDIAPIVIVNDEHRFLAAEQLREVGTSASILLEPEGRNTGPAIALAAFQAMADFHRQLIDTNATCDDTTGSEAPILLVLAADHVIQDVAAFERAVTELEPAVRQGKFGIFGIVPTEPATGFGYIEASEDSGRPVAVGRFVEKPDLATAQKYVQSGKFYWNSGMFLLRADRYLDELKRFCPDIFAACETAFLTSKTDLDFVRIDSDVFKHCPGDSIDYAVMEPLCAETEADQVVMVPLDAGWCDVGSWSSLWQISEKGVGGNALLPAGSRSGKSIMKDTQNTFIVTSDRLVATLGVEDLVVVDTTDALLVAHRDRAQDVKAIVAEIREHGYSQYECHREVYRPWGQYDSIGQGAKYQVKRIRVKPGGRLSLQVHQQRAEHWVVVSGTAKVTNGDKTFLVHENESTFIPIGQRHSLENPTCEDIEIIEVQSGSYFGEDDITRLEDLYGRL